MSETSVYLGIDNGISGGLCALSATPGVGPIAYAPMPIQKTRKGNEIDVNGVWSFLVNHRPETLMVVIEEPGGSQSATAARSMAASFAALRTVCDLKGLRYLRITPQSWQKPMLNCDSGDTKKVARTLVKSLWPGWDWLATPRSTVPHDGMIDAALIAEHARRMRL